MPANATPPTQPLCSGPRRAAKARVRLWLTAAVLLTAGPLGASPPPAQSAQAAAPRTSRVPPVDGLRARAGALLARCRPIDLHSDGLLQVRRGPHRSMCDPAPGLATATPHLLASNFDAVVQAIFAHPLKENPPEAARAALRAYDHSVAVCPALLAARATDLVAAGPVGKVRTILAMEGAEALQGRPEALRAWAELGLLYISLTWNPSNDFADGAGGPELHRGLSASGLELVRLAGRLGVLVDVSHASDATARAVLAESRLPVIASHSGARAVFAHRRNLPDDLIAAIARSGGVVGLNAHCGFAAAEGSRCDTGAMVRHALHLRRVGGAGILALGADWDGRIDAPADLPHPGHIDRLVVALLRGGLSEQEVCGVLGDNVRSLMRRVQAVRIAGPPRPQGPPAGLAPEPPAPRSPR